MMNDSLYMMRCMELAQRAKGHTAPNPMVGAVLVSQGQVIGEGWHHFYGADHAEVNCIKNVSPENRHRIPGSTMYVNLEPCAHKGITPPCANRLVAERIGKVIIANTDPFELVRGKGIDILKAAGVQVQTGLLEEEGAWLDRRFFTFHRCERPYIILKWAQTADGYIAPADRSRIRITGDEANRLVHKWRTEEGAIMVGTTTALMDDPRLTARLWEGRHPLRIVLDRQLKIPTGFNIYDDTAGTWVVNEKKNGMEGNINFVNLSYNDSLLGQILKKLHEAKILSMIVEGGAQLINSFVAQGLWDEARVFTAGSSLGEGIAAPMLRDELMAFEMKVGEDMLRVFTNKNAAAPYVAGMEL
jgi:diaminohydroxyphosphoribosylaminopyrimidine deaminase / 5-amino-6-(5-phosphoribosylamino)uracil reductase